MAYQEIFSHSMANHEIVNSNDQAVFISEALLLCVSKCFSIEVIFFNISMALILMLCPAL